MKPPNEVFLVPNVTGPTEAIAIDPQLCVGCYRCADICRMQVIMRNPVPGKPPVVVYPDECWYCACCVEECHTGALQMRLPINQRILFKRKETGAIYRIGQKAPPPKSYFVPPYGWLDSGESDPDAHAVSLLLFQAKVSVIAVVSGDVPSYFGRRFGCSDEKKLGKTAAALRRIGFKAVFFADDLSASLDMCKRYTDAISRIWAPAYSLPLEQLRIVFVDSCNEEYDDMSFHLTPQTVYSLFVRACVSNFSAREVWKQLPEESFDLL